MESASDISRELALRAEAFCRSYFPNGRLAGNYWQIGDTSGAEGGNLVIRLSDSPGRKAGKWTDYATGEHGDLLDLIPHATSATEFAEVMEEARSFLGQPEIQRIKRAPARASQRSSEGPERARRLFALGAPIAGTPAEAYLRNRDITRLGGALAYHPAVYYREPKGGPTRQLLAMLARITDNAGELTGVARTWLDIKRRAVPTLTSRSASSATSSAMRCGSAAPARF